VAGSLLAAGSFPTFTGTRARPQDDATIELGIIRNDLQGLRSFRSRTATWLLVADTAMDWERLVSRDLVEALASPPDEFAEFARARNAAISTAGPDIAGGVIRVALPEGRGEAVLAAHLPDLLTTSRALGNLVNAPHPGRGHFLSAVQLESGDSWLKALYLPKSPRALSRGMPPRVPLFPLPDGGSIAYAVLGDDSAEGADAMSLGKKVATWGKGSKLDLSELGAWPRREGSLTESLRSVRVDTSVLAVPSGWYRTLSMAPGTWKMSKDKVRHPARVLAAGLPVAFRGEEGTEVRSAVVAIVAYYTPLLLTPEEAPLWLGVEPRTFFAAVHGGELPFFRSGDAVFFLRGHLDRWGERKARTGGGKPVTPVEAAELAKAWGDKYKLRGLARASAGPLPLRFVPVPEEDKADLVDARVEARARVYQDDLSAWLKHFEPGLKQGKQAPVWSFRSQAAGVTLTAAPTLPSDAQEQPPGAAEGLMSDSPSAFSSSSSSSSDGDWSIEILDFYPETDVCLTGGEMTAAVAFILDGVPLGESAKLRLEWDLSFGGRSIARDAWKVERESGSHEVEFVFDCPTTEGDAELYVTLFVPNTAVEAEATTPLEIQAYGGRSWKKLSMPAAKTCKEVAFSSSEDDGDFGMSTTAGLSSSQILKAVRAFQEQTLRCYRGGVTISGRLVLELTVECDGRVVDSLLEDDSIYGDPNFAQCVADTFKYAPFPAHDREGGAVFLLPLLYE
jgi:hypothetical protein